jgi:hypothetical protein
MGSMAGRIWAVTKKALAVRGADCRPVKSLNDVRKISSL